MILCNKDIKQVNLTQLQNDYVKNGLTDKYLLLVPTKRRKRQLTVQTVDNTPVKGLSVLNIETLGTVGELLYSYCLGRPEMVSDAAAYVYIRKIFHNIDLHYYQSKKHRISIGSLQRMRLAFAEFKRRNLTPEIIADNGGDKNNPANAKARDLANIYAEYCKQLKTVGLLELGDIYTELQSVAKEIFESAFRKLYPNVETVFLQGYSEFSVPEIDLIRKIADVPDLKVFVDFDYYKFNSELFSHLDNCYELLLQRNFFDVDDLETDFLSPYQKAIRQSLFAPEVRGKCDDNSIKKIEIIGKTQEEEVRLIAKEIKRLLLNKLTTPDEICVCVNLIGEYAGLFNSVFMEYGVPLNLTDRKALSVALPVGLLYNILDAANNDFYYKSVLRIVSNPLYCGAGASFFEIYKTATDLRITAGYNNWMKQIELVENYDGGAEEFNNVIESAGLYSKVKNEILALHSLVKPFEDELLPEEFASAFLSLVQKLRLFERIFTMPEEVIEENIRAARSLLSVVEELTRLLKHEYSGGKKFPLSFYLEQLRVALTFTRFNVLEKPGAGVLVTTLDEIRGFSFKYLFIAGMYDGNMPSKFQPEIFTPEKFARSEKKHHQEQQYLFYQALHVCRGTLYLTRPLQNDRSDFTESAFSTELKKIFDFETKSATDFKSLIYSEAEKSSFEGRKIHASIENKQESFDVLMALADKSRITPDERFNEFNGIIGTEDESFSEEIKKLSSRVYSVSQLETYAACPFKFFLERVVRVKITEEPEEEAAAKEIGSILHKILFDFYSEWNKKSKPLKNCDEQIFNEAKDLLFRIAKNNLESSPFTPALSDWDKERILGIAGNPMQSILYKFLEAEQKGNQLTPAYFELSFEISTENTVISESGFQLPPINLRGKIDRVDINIGEKLFTVVDYKTGGKKPSADDLVSGKSLQLPVYLYAAAEILKKNYTDEFFPLFPKIYSLRYEEKDFGLTDVKAERMRIDDSSNYGDKTDAVIDATQKMVENALLKAHEHVHAISSGFFPLTSDPKRLEKVCKYCQFQPVCRVKESLNFIAPSDDEMTTD